MSTFKMYAKPCRLTDVIGLVLLLCASFGPLQAQNAEISECVYSKVAAVSQESSVLQSTFKALQCLDSDPVRFFDFAFYAQTNKTAPLCNRFDELTTACKSWLRSETLQAGHFNLIAGIIHQCVAPLSSIDLKLKRAGIATPETFTAALRSGLRLSKQCKVGEENAEVKPTVAWGALCNDYVESPVSFWTVNDEYYEPCKTAERTACTDQEASLKKGRLLRGFSAASPLSIPWQRTVASIIAIDSIAYGKTAEERASAAKVLGQHGDYSPSVMYTLLHALRDPDANVRAESALALRTQGNRSPLVVYSLISLLYDSDVTPYIKGNVALALREQAIQWECIDTDLNMTGLNTSWKKTELGQAIPACQKVNQASKDQSLQEDGAYFGLTKLGPMLDTACAIAEGDPNANLFDAISQPNQLADFDIARNLCYLDKKVSPHKLIGLARLVLTNMLSDDDDEVKIRALIALRNLGEPINGDTSVVNRIKGEFLSHSNYRVREAAIFALTKAAKSQQWLVTELVRMLKLENSPAVRRTLVASLSTLVPMTAKAGNTVYQHYTNAIRLAYAVSDICNPESEEFAQAYNLMLSLGTNEGAFYSNGLDTARESRIDLECPDGQLVTYPKLLESAPKIGQDAVPLDATITLEFSGKLNADIVRQYVELVARDRKMPYAVTELTVSGTGTLERTVAKLKPDAMLSNGQVYKVLMRKGLHHEGKTPAQGLSWDRNFLFQTDSLGVGDQVFDLISSDPSMDVRFSAAEVFAKEQPKLVFDFLYPLLDDGNPETAMRAANYLSSGLLNLDYIGQLPQDQQVETLTDLLSKIMKYVDQNSRDLNTRKAAAFMDFQYFPTLGQQFNLIQSLLEQSWLGLPVKQEVVENLKLEQWLFGMMLKDFPQKTYTEYERIYYGSVRTLIKDILNNHVIDRDKFRSIDYKLYEKMPLKSEED